MVDVFRKGKFEMFSLTETKLKTNGEVSWCGVNGIIAVERAREVVAILLKYMWPRAVIEFGCVSSRIFWINFKFSRAKVCVVVRYSPNEGDGEERDRF